MEGHKDPSRMSSLPYYSGTWSPVELPPMTGAGEKPVTEKPLQKLLDERWADLPAKEMWLLVGTTRGRKDAPFPMLGRHGSAPGAPTSSHSYDKVHCLQGSSEETVHRPIPLGLHVPTQQGRDQVERCWECPHCRVNQPLPLPPSKNFILMQNCQAYQVSHHSLSVSSLIQGIPTELAGGSGEKRRGGGLQGNGIWVPPQPPWTGSLLGPFCMAWGRVNCRLQGKRLVLSSPLLCSSPTPAFRLPPLPALCPDLAGSVPHPSWAA